MPNRLDLVVIISIILIVLGLWITIDIISEINTFQFYKTVIVVPVFLVSIGFLLLGFCVGKKKKRADEIRWEDLVLKYSEQ